MGRINRFGALHLAMAFVVSLMLPVLILIFTEHNSFWVSLACALIPLGCYMVFASLASRSGVMVWLGLPLIFFSAFQIVISYLFGSSVVAADMFLNLLTTNPDEAGELLSNIYPAIIFVVLIYLPLLWVAMRHIRRRIILLHSIRIRMATIGVIILLLGCGALAGGDKHNTKQVLRDELFPANVIYNLAFAILEKGNINNYPTSSQHFSFGATRKQTPSSREIYVLVIGEASRAASWQLFGYERATNPKLSMRGDVMLFRNVITQSNTTHKSVPMMLSSVHPSQHKELYRRKGLLALFNEVGFTTYFISNQSPQGAMIDHLASDAHHVVYMGAPRLDMQLVSTMRLALAKDNSPKLLFILHCYGSHFSYHQRYPQEYAHFLPDDDVAISKKNIEPIRNAYDNSIRYTDFVLNEVITTLEGLDDVVSGVYYCADHGEDLFDGEKERFLHASPTVSYYQLHVASLMWFSPRYRAMFPDKVEAVMLNETAPATTYSIFHTMADMAAINSRYIEPKASLLNSYFDAAAVRYYLNDHNRAVKLNREMGIDDNERALFTHHGIVL